MIDVHCHLEQKDFDNDRDSVIERCKKDLKSIITCCARPRDFDLTMKMVSENRGFVFASAGIHPIYIKEFDESEKINFFDTLRNHRKDIVAIGETGLDFHWISENEWREKQNALFRQSIELAKELDLPVIVHSRNSSKGVVEILEDEKPEKVLWHLFGSKEYIKLIINKDWKISIGPLIKQSKLHKKIAKEMPLENIMLETDSPWFGFGQRSEPPAIKLVCEKVSEVKKISFEEVWQKCGDNAREFFRI